MSSADALTSVRLVLAADQPAAAGALTLSPGRLTATVAGVLGLIGVVAGALALARRDGRPGAGTARRRGTGALAAGLVAVALGGLVVVTADGGVGTGNGLGGGVVAVVVGLVAGALGGLARARSRRTGAPGLTDLPGRSR
jgi:uncharacterized protein DUF6223